MTRHSIHGCSYQDFRTNADYMDAVITSRENSNFIYKADMKDAVIDESGYPYALPEKEIAREKSKCSK